MVESSNPGRLALLLLVTSCASGWVPDGGAMPDSGTRFDAGTDHRDSGAAPHDGGRDAGDAGDTGDAGDAGDARDAGSCPPECSECVDGRCHMFSCPDAGCVCPAGLACSVTSSSPGGIDCSRGTQCNLECSGCRGPVLCGTDRCDVRCTGIPSCLGAVDCSRAESCSISCTQDACRGPISCAGSSCSIQCSLLFNGCLGTQPILCDAGDCRIDCRQGCGGRSQISCGTGRCEAEVYCPDFGSCPTVDCSRSCACRVTDHGPRAAATICPSGCDAGCGPDAGCDRCP